jgi:hypothetical protein
MWYRAHSDGAGGLARRLDLVDVECDCGAPPASTGRVVHHQRVLGPARLRHRLDDDGRHASNGGERVAKGGDVDRLRGSTSQA